VEGAGRARERREEEGREWEGNCAVVNFPLKNPV